MLRIQYDIWMSNWTISNAQPT